MFVSSTIHYSQKMEAAQMSKDEWINNMWYTHTVEFYSALKTKEILTHAITWMNTEDIIAREISRSQKRLKLHDPSDVRYLEVSNSQKVG